MLTLITMRSITTWTFTCACALVVLFEGVCGVVCAQSQGPEIPSETKTPVDRRLSEAIEAGSIAGITIAVQQGANLNADWAGQNSLLPPLTHGILKNKPDVVKALLDAGLDPNKPHNFEYPLVSAVNADTRILKIVLQRPINDLNAHFGERETALEHASSCKPYIYAELIRSNGYSGEPPDCVEDVRLLLAAGADPNFASLPSGGPLDKAIHWNNVEIAKLLIDAGAKINEKNGYDRTPLMVALEEYDFEMYNHRKHFKQRNGATLPMIELLLGSGADPNVTDAESFEDDRDRQIPYPRGYTPLTLAARHGWAPVVRTLLQHGASRELPRGDGATALSLAQLNGYPEVVKLLRQASPTPAR